MNAHKKAYFYVAAVVILWSSVASVFKISLRGADFIQFVFYASCSSLMSLMIIALFSGKLKTIFTQNRKDYLFSALLGLINPFIYYLVLAKVYTLLPAQEAQPLNWIWPIVLTILSAIFLRQKSTLRQCLAFAVSFAGVVVIAARGDVTALSFDNPLGVILALSSSIFWAFYWVLNLKDKRDSVVKLTTAFLFGTIYCAIAVILYSDFNIGFGKTLAGSIYIGLFEMGVAFVLWLKALSTAQSGSSIAIYAYLTPFLSLLIIHFVVGEAILASSILGLALIMTGVIINRG